MSNRTCLPAETISAVWSRLSAFLPSEATARIEGSSRMSALSSNHLTSDQGGEPDALSSSILARSGS